MEHKDPIAVAQFQRRKRSRRQVIFNLLALLSGGAATLFFATAGPVDPLRDTFFSLAVALDLLTIFLVWKSLPLGIPWWLQAEEERGPFVLRLPAAGVTLTVRILRGPWSRVRVIWHGPLWRYACLLAATLLYGASLALFLLQGETMWTYLAWVGGIGLLVLAYVPTITSLPRPHIKDILVVGGLLAIGLALRLYHLEQLPLKVHGDMASVGLQAREILAGRSPGWFTFGWATIPMWGYAHEALSMRIWGDSLYGLRMSAVLSGLFSLLGVYYLGKEGWIKRVGVWALAALVVDVVHIHFSRIPSYIDPVPWAVWSFYFLLRGYYRRSPIHWALAGITAAVASNMYFSGRVVIPVLVLFFLYAFFFHRRVWNENREGVVAFVLSLLFTWGPMLLVIVQHWSAYASRARFVLITDPGVYHHLLLKYQANSLREIFLEQFQRTFLTYQYYGDTSTQFGYTHPMLNPWLVPLFLIGVGVLTGRLRHAGNFLISTWLFLGLFSGSVLTTDAPFWPRLVIITPANALAIGLGIAWLEDVLGIVGNRWRSALWTMTMVLLIAWAGWQNWTTYTQTMGKQAGLNDFAARVILTFGERPACYVQGAHGLDEREFRFLLQGRDDLEIHLTTWRDDAAQCAQRHGIVVALPEERSLVDLIAETYPGGRLSEIRAPAGEPRIVIYEMP